MQQEVKVLGGQNIFDLVLNTYKDLNLTYKLIQENPDIDSINFDFDNAANVTILYDPGFSIPLPAPLNQSSSTPANSIKTLKLQTSQSLFDACLMTYGNLENIYKLLQDSGIDSINETDLTQKVLTYDSDLIDDNALYNAIKSSGFIFATNITVAESVIVGYYFDLKSLFTDGHSWRFKVDDSGMMLQPGEDLGITDADTSFTIGQWEVTVNDTGELNGNDLGVVSGELFKLLRSSQAEGHIWKFTPNSTEPFPQPGTDLGL